MTALGQTSVAVAKSLRVKRIRGDRDASGILDPVANYLRDRYGVDEVEVLARHAYVGHVYGVIPAPVRDFLAEFLKGDHDDLRTGSPVLAAAAVADLEEDDDFV